MAAPPRVVVAQLFDLPERSGHEQLAGRHPVLGQRPSLVRTNDRGRPQRFDGGQVAYDHVAARHALRGHRHCECHGWQESLGDVGHDDADSEQEALPERQSEGTTDREERHTEQRGESRDDPADASDLHLKRRRRFTGRLCQVGHAPELRPGSGGKHHRRCLAVDD
jgi:hypothetical protein